MVTWAKNGKPFRIPKDTYGIAEVVLLFPEYNSKTDIGAIEDSLPRGAPVEARVTYQGTHHGTFVGKTTGSRKDLVYVLMTTTAEGQRALLTTDSSVRLLTSGDLTRELFRGSWIAPA